MCHKRAYARRREAEEGLAAHPVALGQERRQAGLSLPGVWPVSPDLPARLAGRGSHGWRTAFAELVIACGSGSS